MSLLNDYWTEAEYAEERRVSVETTRRERYGGRGAPYIKLGCQILYPIEEARAWLAAQVRRPVRERERATA